MINLNENTKDSHSSKKVLSNKNSDYKGHSLFHFAGIIEIRKYFFSSKSRNTENQKIEKNRIQKKEKDWLELEYDDTSLEEGGRI